MAKAPASRWSSPSPRVTLGAAALLLTVSLFAPLWITRMEAPQYRGEEILEVRVSAGRVEGDIHEIDLLNQYVGVHLPLDTPELGAAPWWLGGLLTLALAGVLLASGRQRAVTWVLLAAMLLTAVGGLGLLQYRLWEMGHVRDKSIFEGVPDFTPPVLGSKKIANFTVYMSLGIGGWAYALALVLVGLTAWSSSPLRARPQLGPASG
jgi:copper chaperone NosL